MLTRWAPMERVYPFDRFNKAMDELFGTTEWLQPTYVPAVDISETDKSITFLCDLPGLHQEDVEVEVVGDRLIIKGRREFSREEKKENFVSVERGYGAFSRTFDLHVPVTPEEITAQFKDGVLTVAVPKIPGVPTQKIPIKKG